MRFTINYVFNRYKTYLVWYCIFYVTAWTEKCIRNLFACQISHASVSRHWVALGWACRKLIRSSQRRQRTFMISSHLETGRIQMRLMFQECWSWVSCKMTASSWGLAWLFARTTKEIDVMIAWCVKAEMHKKLACAQIILYGRNDLLMRIEIWTRLKSDEWRQRTALGEQLQSNYRWVW